MKSEIVGGYKVFMEPSKKCKDWINVGLIRIGGLVPVILNHHEGKRAEKEYNDLLKNMKAIHEYKPSPIWKVVDWLIRTQLMVPLSVVVIICLALLVSHFVR